ncbi:MAG: 50S ribosomal protein L18 [Clostridiales bacterium]|jgi:large subunit ribosomal protein L18|nr:50S ribosomal protein L18 [Clostridiales bacterium]MDY4654918.1 50S ribosomal protein L18 [Eubacteriales bacterium]
MISKVNKNEIRKARHDRMRFYINGTATHPRLNVYRSLNHIYAQIIDDSANNGSGNTLVSASTVEKEIAAQIKDMSKSEASKFVGKVLAERAKEKGIEAVVFDRGGYLYTGRIAALADGAREAGLKF